MSLSLNYNSNPTVVKYNNQDCREVWWRPNEYSSYQRVWVKGVYLVVSNNTSSKQNVCTRIGVANTQENNVAIARALHYNDLFLQQTSSSIIYRGDYITLNGIDYVLVSGTSNNNLLFVANQLQSSCDLNGSDYDDATYSNTNLCNHINNVVGQEITNILGFTPTECLIDGKYMAYRAVSVNEITDNLDVVSIITKYDDPTEREYWTRDYDDASYWDENNYIYVFDFYACYVHSDGIYFQKNAYNTNGYQEQRGVRISYVL